MGLFDFFKREPIDWRFVGCVEVGYRHQAADEEDWVSYEMSYYLYENQHGDRKIDVIDSRPGRGDLNVKKLTKTDWVFRNDDYRNVIHPWLTGFRNKKFPTYEKAPMHDFKRMLEED